MRNKEQIEQLLEAAKYTRLNRSQYTFFHEDKWADLDLVIKILEDTLSGKSLNWFDKYYHLDNETGMEDAVACMDWLDECLDENYSQEWYESMIEDQHNWLNGNRIK